MNFNSFIEKLRSVISKRVIISLWTSFRPNFPPHNSLPKVFLRFVHITKSARYFLILHLAFFKALRFTINLASAIHQPKSYLAVRFRFFAKCVVRFTHDQVGFVHLATQMLEVFEIFDPIALICIGPFWVAICLEVSPTVKGHDSFERGRVWIG